MLSRLSLTFFLLFFSNKVFGAQGEGGMPQLNPASFSSQIFWLFISFSILFLIVHFFLLPRLKKVREHRDETINNYLSQTQNLNHKYPLKLGFHKHLYIQLHLNYKHKKGYYMIFLFRQEGLAPPPI